MPFAEEDSAKLCKTVCMVQYFPLTAKQNLADCPACLDQRPEEVYAQYDNVRVILEVSVNRSSLVPEVMRPYRGAPKTSDPYFADAGIKVQQKQSLDMCLVMGVRFCNGLCPKYRTVASECCIT